MCSYKGQREAEICEQIASLEHELEELLAQVPARSWAIAAREAREALLRRRDARAVEVLDRIARRDDDGPVSEVLGMGYGRLVGHPNDGGV